MTPDTLAAIVARDAEWTDYRQDPESVSPSADRRALLALLRETRDALATIEQDAGWLHDNVPDYTPDGVATLRDIAREIAKAAYQALAALDTETTAGHRLIGGYCPDCGGSCLIVFAQP